VVEAEPVPGILLGGTESARSTLGVARETLMNILLRVGLTRSLRLLGILGIFIGRFTLNVAPNATGKIGLSTTHLEIVVLAILSENHSGTVHKVVDSLCHGGIVQLRFLGLGNILLGLVVNGILQPLRCHVRNVVGKTSVHEFDHGVLGVLVESVLSNKGINAVLHVCHLKFVGVL